MTWWSQMAFSTNKEKSQTTVYVSIFSHSPSNSFSLSLLSTLHFSLVLLFVHNHIMYLFFVSLQVVIKYVPFVGDSKRAMDEYTSEIFMGGHNTIVLHNTCEDSLLAAPIILDLVILAELCERIEIKRGTHVFWFLMSLTICSLPLPFFQMSFVCFYLLSFPMSFFVIREWAV